MRGHAKKNYNIILNYKKATNIGLWSLMKRKAFETIVMTGKISSIRVTLREIKLDDLKLWHGGILLVELMAWRNIIG